MTTLDTATYFNINSNPDIVSNSAPSGAVGAAKDTNSTGVFVYSQLPFSVWFKKSGTWQLHQAFTAENLVSGITFRWDSDATHVFFQTAETGEHNIHVQPRYGSILIDGTPDNGENQVDTLILSSGKTLTVLGASDDSVTTATTHSISDASPVTIDDGCSANVVVTEVVGDYTDSLSSKLAAYYKFEDNANDSGIAENHGTASAGCNYVAGKAGLGQALHQTTADAHVSLNNPDLMNLGPDFTVAAWVYVPSVQSATDPVDNPYNDIAIFTNVDSYGDWTYLDGFIFAVPKPGYAGGWGLPSNCLALYSGIGQGNGIYSWAWYAVASPQNSFPFDEWVHVALTFSGSDQANWGGNEKLFINGQLQTLTPRTSQPAQNAMEWTSDPLNVLLGASLRTSHPKPLAGSGELKYDEIAIWKRELSESEIADLYNAGSGVDLDVSYLTTETVRNDFTVQKQVVVTAPEGTDTTNIKVEITK